MLVLVLAVPILRLRHTIDAATDAVRDISDQSGQTLGQMTSALGSLDTAIVQMQTTLDGVNVQLARIDQITENAQHVTSNVANLSTVVSAAAASPIVKIASLGYGVRRAASRRRRAETEAEIRDEIRQRRRAGRSDS